MTGILSWIVRAWTDVENNIVSVERVNEYADTAKEVSGVKYAKQYKDTEVITEHCNRVYLNAQPCCYCSLQASWTIEGSTLPLDWPQKGTLQFQDYGLQYRKGLELALKGITLNINEREKVSLA